jgi:prepilin-type N-terminal cleavage/methylation domain-containing protein
MNLGTRAFTLIELLVVIAIIAILASFATPTIGSAIERGRSAKCVSNLRQIGVAVQQYIADNDYRFPPIETVPPTLNNEGRSALETLEPYGVTISTLTCPSDSAGPNTVARYGASYHFSPVLQNELASGVNIYGRRGIFRVPNIGRLTVCTDYEDVHASAGKLGMNALKADGRVIQH